MSTESRIRDLEEDLRGYDHGLLRSFLYASAGTDVLLTPIDLLSATLFLWPLALILRIVATAGFLLATIIRVDLPIDVRMRFRIYLGLFSIVGFIPILNLIPEAYCATYCTGLYIKRRREEIQSELAQLGAAVHEE
jgi:hypothetical protein